MATGSATAERPEAPLFADGLGERVVAVDAATGDLLQILRVRPELLAVPSFEFALRERAARLANFRHAYYARVRRIDRHPGGLAIVSDHVEGVRLSEMLRVAHTRGLQLDLNAALCLLRQLVPSVALLHENARDVAHGLIAPERLIVTPRARLIVVEHVLGSAVEQLQFKRERLWQELRVSVPPAAGAIRFDHRADVTAIGLTALSMVLGRPLNDDEYPHRVATLLADARARAAGGEDQPLPEALHAWIGRALQLDIRQGFASATDAQMALEDAMAEDSGFVAAPVALETFLSRYIAALLEPGQPVTPVSTTPVKPVVAPPSAPIPVSSTKPPVADAHETTPARPMPSPAIDSGAAKDIVKPAVPVSQVIDRATRPVASAPAPAPVPPAPVAPPPVAPPPVAAAPVVPPPVVHAPIAPAPMAPPPVAHAPVTAAPVAPAPALRAPQAPFAPQAPSAPPAHPRDITELLKDFDLPPSSGATAPVHEERHVEPAKAPAAKRAAAKSGGGSSTMMVIAAVAVVALGVGGYFAWRAYKKPLPPALGTLSVQTNPPGASVFVDGVAHGNTPARVSLAPGSHILELRGRGVPRVIPVNVTSGAEASQYLELPETPVTGSLLVQSEPAGARVSIDGVEHGTAPTNVTDLAPGEHEVVLQADGGAPVKQKVVIQAGVTASILAPVATSSAGPVSGWLSVKAPVTIEVREGGRLIGTTDADRIMVTAGKHDLELANDTLGYHASRSVQVPPGKVAALTLEMPQGTISINATPWADVFIDGKSVGQTPIGNLPLAIGPHEVIFRHPQLGEKRQAVSVTMNGPVRTSVDMSQK
jgi:hypothetical protein